MITKYEDKDNKWIYEREYRMKKRFNKTDIQSKKMKTT